MHPYQWMKALQVSNTLHCGLYFQQHCCILCKKWQQRQQVVPINTVKPDYYENITLKYSLSKGIPIPFCQDLATLTSGP